MTNIVYVGSKYKNQPIYFCFVVVILFLVVWLGEKECDKWVLNSDGWFLLNLANVDKNNKLTSHPRPRKIARRRWEVIYNLLRSLVGFYTLYKVIVSPLSFTVNSSFVIDTTVNVIFSIASDVDVMAMMSLLYV